MAGKLGCWVAFAVLGLGLSMPGTALAGPYFGDWGWCWHPGRDCPCGAYAPLHYWVPGAYKARAWVHPSYLDQYPPGPAAGIPPSYIIDPYRCRSTLPAPTAPYADPTGYYGRPIAPP